MGVNNQNEAAIKAKSEEAARKAVETMTPGALFAFQLAAKNLKNGVFWGFTDLESVRQHADDIRGDKNIIAHKVGVKDCIIEVPAEYILTNIVRIVPDAFSKQDIQKIRENMASAIVEFEKFLINKGINNPSFGSTIGIYCTNNVTTITYKGCSYPAFRLNIEMVLNILAQNGYMVKVGGSFMPVQQIVNGNMDALWKSTQLSPTKTGVFLNIKSSWTPDQLKARKKQLDARYKV